MKLVKLNNEYTVMPDEIKEVKVSWESHRITVWMKDGNGHSVHADHGKSLSETHTRLINEINEALQ